MSYARQVSQFNRAQYAYENRSPMECSAEEEAHYAEVELEESIRDSLNLGDHWEYKGDGRFESWWQTKHTCRRDHKSGGVKVGDRYTVTMTRSLTVDCGKVRTFLSKRVFVTQRAQSISIRKMEDQIESATYDAMRAGVSLNQVTWALREYAERLFQEDGTY